MRRSSNENKLKMWFLMLTCWYRLNEGLLTELYKMRKGSWSACCYPSHNWPAQNCNSFGFALNLLHKTLQVWLQLAAVIVTNCLERRRRPLMPWIYSMSSFVDYPKYLHCVKLSSVCLIIVGRMTWETPMVGFVFIFKHCISFVPV